MKKYQILSIFIIASILFSCQNNEQSTLSIEKITGQWSSEPMLTNFEELGKVKVEFDFSDSLCLFKPFHKDFVPFELEGNKISIETEKNGIYAFKIMELTDTTMLLEAGNVNTLLTLEFFEYGELSKIPLKREL